MQTAPELIETAKDDNLIFDVGLHRGEDTDFYLRKGFRVVAFEANPSLVEHCRLRFSGAITDGRLTIVSGAIVNVDGETKLNGTVQFFVNEGDTVWGTTQQDWMERNLDAGNPSRTINVQAVDFAEELKRHGVPYYMKVDIEGCDLICLEALAQFKHRPTYVSIESDKTSLEGIRREILLLRRLDYDSFQAVEQSVIGSNSLRHLAHEGLANDYEFLPGSSGPFGSDLPGAWESSREVLRRYRAIRLGYLLLGDDGLMYHSRVFSHRKVRNAVARMLIRFTGGAVPGWYDTHARLAMQR